MDEAGATPVIPKDIFKQHQYLDDTLRPAGSGDENGTVLNMVMFPVPSAKTASQAQDIAARTPFVRRLYRHRYFKTKKPEPDKNSFTLLEKEAYDLTKDAFTSYFNKRGPFSKTVEIGDGVYVPAYYAKRIKELEDKTFKKYLGESRVDFADRYTVSLSSDYKRPGTRLVLDNDAAADINRLADHVNSKVRAGVVDGSWTLETDAWNKLASDVKRNLGGRWTAQTYAIRDSGILESGFAQLASRAQYKGKLDEPLSWLSSIWQFDKYTLPKNVQMTFRRWRSHVTSADTDIKRAILHAKKTGENPVEAIGRLYTETSQFVTKRQANLLDEWDALKKSRPREDEDAYVYWYEQVKNLRQKILAEPGDFSTRSGRMLRSATIANDSDDLTTAINAWSSERTTQINEFVDAFGLHAFKTRRWGKSTKERSGLGCRSRASVKGGSSRRLQGTALVAGKRVVF